MCSRAFWRAGRAQELTAQETGALLGQSSRLFSPPDVRPVEQQQARTAAASFDRLPFFPVRPLHEVVDRRAGVRTAVCTAVRPARAPLDTRLAHDSSVLPSSPATSLAVHSTQRTFEPTPIRPIQNSSQHSVHAKRQTPNFAPSLPVLIRVTIRICAHISSGLSHIAQATHPPPRLRHADPSAPAPTTKTGTHLRNRGSCDPCPWPCPCATAPCDA